MEEEVEPIETKFQRQILTGWLFPSKDLVDIQVLLASARQWLDLTLGHFILAGHASHLPKIVTTGTNHDAAATSTHNPDQTSQTNTAHPAPVMSDLRLRYGAYLNDASTATNQTTPTTVGGTPTSDAKTPAAGQNLPSTSPTHAPAWVVITELIFEANKVRGFPISLRAITILYTCIPYCIRWYLGQEIIGGTRWTCWLYAFCEFWINFFLMTANLAFINVCVTDFRRREYLFNRLQAILLDGFVRVPASSLKQLDPTKNVASVPITEENSEQEAAEVTKQSTTAQAALPQPTDYQTVRLCMNNCHNLLLWWYTRLIIQDYGRPYLLRLQTYTGSFIVFCLILAGILFGAALGFFVVDTVGLVLCLCMVALMVVMVVTVLYFGLLANAVRQGHVTMLYKKAITFSTRAERLRTSHTEQSHDSRDAAQLCWILAQACHDDERVNSLRVFGLDCTPQLVTTFSTAMLAALSTGLQVFMRR
ncbi:hypothetical protein BCR44DRAFT_194708 [Catenaria anguillulae PL171]|uniref:Uncharacterized protein n=1 Tax=Catenaria anguillulae PL171 TaxID=765915 RepID=A0A1Y2HGB5_9FUNG|nr:hypothetical protein BCR44DRAFT_194708 [Catenaria anguillulae PL171]